MTVNKRSLAERIQRHWVNISDVARGKAKSTIKSKALSGLDTLCDVCFCQHEIFLCSDVKCSGCELKAHVHCDCAKEMKVPRDELEWLYYQRHKKCEVSAYQISRPDSAKNKKEALKFEIAVDRRKRSEQLKEKEDAERTDRFKMIKLEEIDDEIVDQIPSTSER